MRLLFAGSIAMAIMLPLADAGNAVSPAPRRSFPYGWVVL